MVVTPTRQNALIALGKEEAKTGQRPGSGNKKGLFCFPGRYNQQLEWAARNDLCNREMCVFKRQSGTLTTDGSIELNAAFSLKPEGVSIAVHGEADKIVTVAQRDKTFGKTQKRTKTA